MRGSIVRGWGVGGGGVDMKQIRILFCDQYNHCLACHSNESRQVGGAKLLLTLSATTEAAHSLA